MTNETASRPGVLLVGHGTRNQDGFREMLLTADGVRDLCHPLPLEACFLEMAEPTIDTAISRLYESGARNLIVMPLLLFAAGHAKQDIPGAVEMAAAKYPDLLIRGQTPVLGCHAKLVELSQRRFEEAVSGHPCVSPADTLLIFVGRGSRDPAAIAEMHRFVRIRERATPALQTLTCFLSMASPTFDDTLRNLAQRCQTDLALRRVVLQPHLLFQGDLLARVESAREELSATLPAIQWIGTRHLGPDRLLAAVIGDIIRTSLLSLDEQS